MSKEAKKGRECPATGGVISASECGEKRMSQLACPPTCAHNSFAPANVALFGKIEERLLERMQERLQEQADAETAERLEFEAGGGAFPAYAAHLEAMCRARANDGRTLMENWEGEGWRGLKNDEAVMAKAFMTVRPALLEVRALRDEQTMEVVDLLEEVPAVFAVMDEDWARQARRFTVFLCWRYEAPFFSRISGPSLLVPWCGSLEPLAVLETVAVHLNGPTGKTPLREWLWANMGRVGESIEVLHRVRTMAVMSGRERTLIERQVPARLLDLIEPEEAGAEEMEADCRARWAAFADAEHALLGGKTPRQAAGDEALRPRLVGLMKQEVSLADELRHRKRWDLDLNDLLIELGLKELVSAPPALPLVSEEETEAMIEEEDGRPTLISEMLGAVSLRAMPRYFREPPPRQRVMPMEDIEVRMVEFTRAHATPESALAWFDRAWPGITEAVEAMTVTFDEKSHAVVRLLIAKAAAVLLPFPPHRSGGYAQRVAWNLREDMERLTEMTGDDEDDGALGLWLSQSPQPELCQRLSAEALVMLEDMGLAESMELRIAVLALLKASITELCHWVKWE